MEYRTTETYEAVLFKTFNYPYVGAKMIHRPNGKQAIKFTFDVPNMATVQQIIKDYFNHALAVDAYDHDEATKIVRKIMYDTKNEGR